MLVLSSQNVEHQTGAQVNILIFIFMYSLECQKTKQKICLISLFCQHLTVSTFGNIQNNLHLNLIVGLNEPLKAHLLLQVEAKFFQTTEDAVMMRSLHALVLSTAICGAAGFISSHYTFRLWFLITLKVLRLQKTDLFITRPLIKRHESSDIKY